MDALFDFLFSPAGIAAYVAFWAFKLLAGAWIISQMLRLLPVRTRRKTQVKLGRLRRRAPWYGRVKAQPVIGSAENGRAVNRPVRMNSLG